MPRYVMVIDVNSCVGCMACTIACLRENIARQRSDGVVLPEHPVRHARTRPVELHDVEVAGWPRGAPFFIQCQHCRNAPCVIACPTGASHHTPEGIVVIDKKKCIGCRACMIACPYGARTMYLGDLGGPPPNPYGMEQGYPDKCTFCYHRRREGGWTPACVEACAFHARLFGDVEDPGSEVARIVASGAGVRLREEMGTDPSIVFIPPRKSPRG